MPCLCSDYASLLQVRIPAACAANLRHHAPECRELPRNRDCRSATCTIEMPIDRINAPCAWILPRGPPIHSPCAVIQRAPKGQANSQHKSNNNSNNNSFSISNSKSKIEHAGRDIRHILHSWGGAGSLHRVGESKALEAESMHRVHGSC